TFRYDADAQDPDGDALTFSLLSGPSGMTIDPTTGEISMPTGLADLGTQAVTVHVTDGHGGSADQQFTLTIDTAVPNRPPLFTSTPRVDGEVGVVYSYTAKAFDADGNPLSFALASAPDGMTIDSSTGLITWTPTVDEIGINTVSVAAADDQGAVT